MAYKGYKNKETYTLSKKKDYRQHKAHYQEYFRQYYLSHKGTIKATSSLNYELNRMAACNKYVRYRRRIKTEVLTHYGNGTLACVKCGFNDIRALSIDHINGGGNRQKRELNITGTEMYRWLKKNNYPDGFQTLCHNCQWIKRDENHEYHNYLERREIFKG